ncbi:hypothetical protein WCE19_24215, partial [Enterobacter cloacae]|uniref:hypothetical protein n=1 Tax=Enterobacter cloacae TaxID=550 RepID=UPI0034D5EA29
MEHESTLLAGSHELPTTARNGVQAPADVCDSAFSESFLLLHVQDQTYDTSINGGYIVLVNLHNRAVAGDDGYFY